MGIPRIEERTKTPIKVQPAYRSEEEQDLYEWQVKKIKKSLAQADRGEFVPQAKVDKTFAQWE